MTVDSIFTRPLVLFKLGQHILEIQKANHNWRKLLPLILLSEKVQEGTWIIVGILPAAIIQREEEELTVDKDKIINASDTVDDWSRKKRLGGIDNVEEVEEEEEEEQEHGEREEEGEEGEEEHRNEEKRNKRRKLLTEHEISGDSNAPPLTTGTTNFKKAFKWAKDRLNLPVYAKYRDDCKYIYTMYVYIQYLCMYILYSL